MSRKRTNRKRKNIIVALGFLSCAIIIALMVTLIGHIRKEGEKKAQEEQQKVEQEQENEEFEIKEEEPEPDIEITITEVGDCTLATDIKYAGGATFVREYEAQNDPTYFLRNVKSVFENDDLTVVNFEGVVSKLTVREDKTFAFRSEPEYLEILTSSSVEAAGVANNHTKDYGAQSLEDTRYYLSEAGITNFGYEQTAIYEVKGVKIGLIALNALISGTGHLDEVKELIEKVKAEGAVITIIHFHWGIEKDAFPNDVQKTLGRAAIDYGADLVIGHHPHVLQGIETYKGKKIVYSLGNFCFGGNKNPADKDTMIFQQTFTVRGDEVVDYDNINIIPCSISSVTERNNFQPTILEGSEAERVLKKIEERSQGLSD